MNALTQPQAGQSGRALANNLLFDPVAFEQMQRIGGMLALSPLFPAHLRSGPKDQAIANAVLVLNMAARLNEDVLSVAQAIYFVGGRPGWSASYMIAKANQHGIFENPIDWEVTGAGDSLSVTAFATIKATGRKVSVTCDMAMAKAEGWTKNPKYTSMPQQMLRYRSATFLIRLYCPQIMVGLPTTMDIELQATGGMKDISPDDEMAVVQSRSERGVTDAEVIEDVKADAKPKGKTDAELLAEEKARAEAAAAKAKKDAADWAAKDKAETEAKKEAEAAAKRKAEADMLAEAARGKTASGDMFDSETGELVKDVGDDRIAGHKAICAKIEQDLVDGAPADVTRRDFAEELDLMKAEAPGLFAEIDKTLSETAAAEAA